MRIYDLRFTIYDLRLKARFSVRSPRQSSIVNHKSKMNLLVTGGAGFIGSNVIHHVIDRPEVARLVNLDCLTYAGHLENLEKVARHPKYVFEKVDLRDKAAVLRVVEATRHHPRHASGGGIARGPLHHRAGRFHSHQRRRHVQSARSLPRLLAESKVRSPESEVRSPVSSRFHRRSLWLARPDRFFHRDDALRAELAVFRQQGLERHAGARLSSHLRLADGHHELLEQLRPVSISGKADSRSSSKACWRASRFRSMATA